MNVASPCPGRVEKFLVKPGESYPVGAVLGYLEASAEDAARLGLDALAAERDGEEAAGNRACRQDRAGRQRRGVQPTVRGLPVPGQRRRRQLHVAAHEGAHDRTRPARGRPGGHRRQRRRRAA